MNTLIKSFFGAASKSVEASKSAHAFTLKSLDGSSDLPLAAYKGKALLIVNVASK